MRYLSVCSGIEAASVAWHPLGWKALAFSEIDAFPCAVLAHHYPDVPNLGSLREWREWPSELLVEADVLVGGTPCQSFSVAGLRRGLDDDRGNLMLQFLELADAIDDLRRDAGRPPAWVLWENVPGVFSDSTNGFGALLGGLVGSDTAVVPPPGRSWTNAGVAAGPKRCAAWRVLDAQHFGVAQRRKRVFCLALGGARAWACADALLPVVESLRWHPAPRREAGEGTAPSIAGSLGSRGNKSHTELDGHGAYIPETVGALTDGAHNGGGSTDKTPTPAASSLLPEVAWCLQERDAKGADSDTKPGHLIPVIGGGFDVAHSLRADGFDASEDGTGRGTPLVPIGFAQNQRDEVRAVAVAGALAAEPGMKQQTYIAFGAKDHGADAGEVAPCVAFHPTQEPINSVEVCHALNANANANATAATVVEMMVRRLTPVECARLQGFPDHYLDITYRGKPAADGPKYKALGNSMAVPVIRHIGLSIARAVNGIYRVDNSDSPD